MHELVDVHGTVFLENVTSGIVPRYVNNHGIMSGRDLHQLLQQSKVGYPDVYITFSQAKNCVSKFLNIPRLFVCSYILAWVVCPSTFINAPRIFVCNYFLGRAVYRSNFLNALRIFV